MAERMVARWRESFAPWSAYLWLGSATEAQPVKVVVGVNWCFSGVRWCDYFWSCREVVELLQTMEIVEQLSRPDVLKTFKTEKVSQANKDLLRSGTVEELSILHLVAMVAESHEEMLHGATEHNFATLVQLMKRVSNMFATYRVASSCAYTL